MVTEQEARDMDAAISAFKATDAQTARDQDVIDMATAQTWYDTTIEPTLTWNNSQPDNIQLRMTFDDKATLEALRPTNTHRKRVLQQEIQNHDNRIRALKAGL